jgi:hypothetical protein
MTSPTGPDQNDPQGQSPYGAPQQPPAGYSPQGYDPQSGYNPSPAYGGGPAAAGQRPGMVTGAAVVGVVWGALGALLALLVMFGAFALGAALFGLVALVAVALYGALLFAAIQTLQDKSPRLLLILSYVAIGLSLLQLVLSIAATGGNAFNGILGILIPGVIVFLLLQPQSKQYYASRGISY